MRTLICLIIGLIFFSCKKTASGPDNSTWQPMTVLEYNSTSPISNARVDCYDDSNRVFSTGYTDNTGKYIFTAEEQRRSTRGIIISKPHYITATGGPGERFMYPAAAIRMHLLRQNIYAGTNAVMYYTDPTLNSGIGYHKYITPPPLDTIVNIEVPGNNTYTLYWSVVKEPVCEIYCIPEYLVSSDITGLQLEKFGDTLVTIRY